MKTIRERFEEAISKTLVINNKKGVRFALDACEEIHREECIKLLKWLGDGYNFDKDNNAEKIVTEYLTQLNNER